MPDNDLLLDLDFGGSEPIFAVGMSKPTDYIPEGDYDLEVIEIRTSKSQAQPPEEPKGRVHIRYRVLHGPHAGSEIEDMFSPVPPPRGASGKALFPFQRFHGALLSFGLKIRPENPSFKNFDLTKFIGRKCHSAVRDNTYNGATSSKPVSYDRYDEKRAQASSARATATPAPAPTPAVEERPLGVPADTSNQLEIAAPIAEPVAVGVTDNITVDTSEDSSLFT